MNAECGMDSPQQGSGGQDAGDRRQTFGMRGVIQHRRGPGCGDLLLERDPTATTGVTRVIRDDYRLRQAVNAQRHHIEPRLVAIGKTPGEFVRVAQEALRLRRVTEEIMQLPRSITRLYYRVRFGGESLTPAETKMITDLMNQLDRALVRTNAA